MRSFRRNRQGQLVIIATLIMVVFTLALVSSISQISLSMQELRYEPFQETALSIASDFDRCLTQALRIATHVYNETKNQEEAKAAGNNFIAKWVNSTISSYSNLGLQIAMNASEGEGTTDVLWIIDWDSYVGWSYIYSRFYLNISAYGFEGWRANTIRFVRLGIYDFKINASTNTVTICFQLVQGKKEDMEELVAGLKSENLQVIVDTDLSQNTLAEVENLTYLGGGAYSISFNVDSTIVRNITLTVVTPEEGIIVSANTNNEWSTLYLSNNLTLLFYPEASENNKWLRGKGPKVVFNKSGETKRFESNSVINISLPIPDEVEAILYFSKNGQGEANVTVTLSFNNGTEYTFGNSTLTINEDGPYVFKFYKENLKDETGQPVELDYVPEGSRLFLEVTVYFENSVGSVHLYCVKQMPSLITFV